MSAAELAVVFGLCALVTGPLWARKAWGVWWQWDVRLTSTALLWIIFIAYLFARRYGGPGSRAPGGGGGSGSASGTTHGGLTGSFSGSCV